MSDAKFRPTCSTFLPYDVQRYFWFPPPKKTKKTITLHFELSVFPAWSRLFLHFTIACDAFAMHWRFDVLRFISRSYFGSFSLKFTWHTTRPLSVTVVSLLLSSAIPCMLAATPVIISFPITSYIQSSSLARESSFLQASSRKSKRFRLSCTFVACNVVPTTKRVFTAHELNWTNCLNWHKQVHPVTRRVYWSRATS